MKKYHCLKCPSMEIFLDFILQYSDVIQSIKEKITVFGPMLENMDQKTLRICTNFPRSVQARNGFIWIYFATCKTSRYTTSFQSL